MTVFRIALANRSTRGEYVHFQSLPAAGGVPERSTDVLIQTAAMPSWEV